MEREDGSHLVLESVVGPWLLTVPDTLMVDLGVIFKPKSLFIPVPDPKLKFDTGSRSTKAERNEVYTKALVQNTERNLIITRVIGAYHNRKIKNPSTIGNCLVIIKYLEHGIILKEMFRDELGIEVPFIHGKSAKRVREEIIQEFKEGKLHLLIASSILNEGEDVPLIEVNINAAGGSGEKENIQRTGRSLRKDESCQKTRAINIDLLDEETQYLNSNARRRIAKLEKRYPGCVEVVSLEKVLEVISSNK